MCVCVSPQLNDVCIIHAHMCVARFEGGERERATGAAFTGNELCKMRAPGHTTARGLGLRGWGWIGEGSRYRLYQTSDKNKIFVIIWGSP